MTKAREETIRDGYRWIDQVCPICDQPPTKYIGRRGGQAHRENLGVETEIWQCGKCDLMFPNPMPIPIGGLAQHYAIDPDEWFMQHDESEKSEYAHYLLERAEKLLGHKGRLLEVGVGRGELLIVAKSAGWEVDGIEPSETFAEYVEKKADVKLDRSSIEDAELRAGAYDCIMLGAVLEHLYDPNRIIEKLASALKPGGLLYVDVPNEQGLYFITGNIYQKVRGRDWCVNLAPTFSPYHVFGFGPRSLRALLRKHSLEPKVWTVSPGISLLSSRGGVAGWFESVASKIVTGLSRFGQKGTYIETWAEKSEN